MDTAVFLVVYGLTGHSRAFDTLAIFFAFYAIIIFAPLVAFFVWVQRKTLFLSILAVSLAFGINQSIGALFYRDRPFIQLHLAPLIDGVSGKSFPSDHTAVSFALATVFARVYPQWQILGYSIALAISFSRIIVGVHYPSDVFAGIVVGIVSGCIAYDVYPRRLRPCRKRITSAISHHSQD